MIVSVLTALAAGGCFAAAGVLQQRAAATRPSEESLSPRLLWDLAHQRLWLVGISLAGLSYLLQAVALAFGPLALVQPLIVTELVFAIPISLRLHRLRMGPREWAGALAVAGGLAVAIAATDPRGGKPSPSALEWVIVLGGAAALSAVALVVARSLSGPVRASALAVAAGVVLGTQSAVLKATTERFSHGLLTGLTSWQPYLMAALSILGLLLIQSAFQAGPLAASMPVVDGVQPAVAIVIGLAVFGETVRAGLLPLTVAAVAAAVLLTGIVLLDTSPVVQRLHEQEREDQRSELSAARARLT